MKLSLTGKKTTVLFSSTDEKYHLGVELEKHETIIVCFESKSLVITTLENGFFVEEKEHSEPA